MDRRVLGTTGHMALDDGACPGHVWVLAEVGETRGRLDFASTCSVCGAWHDELGAATQEKTPPSW
jgi:hypothetical protein